MPPPPMTSKTFFLSYHIISFGNRDHTENDLHCFGKGEHVMSYGEDLREFKLLFFLTSIKSLMQLNVN